jgi:hypothetical protein
LVEALDSEAPIPSASAMSCDDSTFNTVRLSDGPLGSMGNNEKVLSFSLAFYEPEILAFGLRALGQHYPVSPMLVQIRTRIALMISFVLLWIT